tara:strand:- start:218 stop:349 length:132 start_codon:yes stop_codon:yes gene_type:complete
MNYFPSLILFLSINIEVIPPDINPKVNDAPTRKPIGSGTVLFI